MQEAEGLQQEGLLVPGPAKSISTANMAAAAEHLVASDLLMLNYPVSVAGAGLPYDLIAEIEGAMVRIQVKSTAKPRKDGKRSGYIFDGRRGYKNSSRLGLKSYKGEVELLAFVAMDIRRVIYRAPGSVSNRLTVSKKAFVHESGGWFNSLVKLRT